MATSARFLFEPLPSGAGITSWVHLGDLHMTKAGEQNHLDLAEIVNELNAAFANAVSFAFLPGDVADDGASTAYAVVRSELDRLNLPWCAIVGDHDVHEKSFKNFLEAMTPRTHFAFTVDSVRFIAMNAFDVPDPASFVVNDDQIAWVKRELQTATETQQTIVLLLHCYPSDLKVGSGELAEVVRNFNVRLIDMGHTHYNEISNDGRTLYTATRSTGQIEEGPVGYSVINLDGGAVSWRFVELGSLPLIMITSPSDERLLNDSATSLKQPQTVRAKFWGTSEAVSISAYVAEHTIPMQRIANSQVWEAALPPLEQGTESLTVEAEDHHGKRATDSIRVTIGTRAQHERKVRDQDNFLEAWPEHGILGTQLGPNKNGKKW